MEIKNHSTVNLLLSNYQLRNLILVNAYRFNELTLPNETRT